MNAHIHGRNVTVRTSAADAPEVRAAARKLACQEAHTATIGKLLSVDDAPGGVTYTWGPVTARPSRGGAMIKITQPAVPAPPAPPVLTPDAIAAMGKRELREALLATLATPAAAPAPTTSPREVPEFIKRAQAVTCRTCRDLGVVRGVGSKAGQPYRTADGAAAAKAAGRAVKCPTHKRASKSA